jgi:class 3 adenylate cyclase/tetratricopeptide (TPR) repeat protein
VNPEERLRPYVAGLAMAWAQTTPDARHRAIDGSLAFVDISGFTTLTERLAAKGKIGAEEMSDLLNEKFAQLLEVAYSYGALLVKWGGDAVLLLFEGPDHAALACRAAHEMQRTMQRIGRLQTSVGAVQLRMSVGISSGTFDFFLVGDRHLELLVAGPAATTTAVMEGIADAGEVLVSPDTAQQLPERCLGAVKESGVLLRTGPPVDPRCRYWPRTAEAVGPSRFVDPAIRDHLLVEVGDSEHRQVAVGFVEVSGVDQLLQQQGPGATAAALHDLVCVVQDECARHRVTFWETDISKDGFKILLVAGAPTSSGHDEDGMLRATRAVLDRHAGPVRLRIGVNRGRVFSGAFGPAFRRSWSVKGDAVNLAARVMGKAEVGDLLATETFLRRVASRVEADLLPPFMVKGKQQPVRAAAVKTVTVDHTTLDPMSGAFVGRRELVDVLLGAAGDAARGKGSALAVVGEPGIGKSRLVDHVCKRLDRTTPVLRGFADDYESATPYFAVRRMLRTALGLGAEVADDAVVDALRRRVAQATPELTPWLPLLAVPFGVEVSETAESTAVAVEFRRARMLTLTVEFLSAVLRDPTVFVVDDVHDADDASAEMLARLAAEAAHRPWLVVVVGRDRPPVLAGDGVTCLSVPPLTTEEAVELVHDSPAAEHLRPHVVRALVARAEGNPLFLRELLSAASAVDGDDLPSTVEELLAARLDRLPPASRRLLRTVSVLGSRFDENLVAELLGQPADSLDWSGLEHYLARHADGSRRFRTTLVRDAAYEGLPFRRRVELHGRAASALEARAVHDGDDRAEALSLHCLAAQRHADAWQHSLRAGDRARAVYANAEALVFLGRAREAARRLPDLPAQAVAELHEAMGDLHGRLAELDDAVAAYREARRRAPRSDHEMLARIAMRIGLVNERAGFPAAADRWMQRANRELRPVLAHDSSTSAVALSARIAVERAYVQHVSGRESAARRLARQAVTLAEPVGDDEVVGRGLMLLDVIDLSSGHGSDPDRVMRAVGHFERCGDLGRQASGWNYLGMTAYFRGDWTAAIDAYRQAADAELRVGDDHSAAIASANIAEILVDQGRLTEAAPLVTGALRLWRATKTPYDIGFGATLLGRLEARRGNVAEAMALFREALTAYAARDELFEVIETEARIAEALLLQGQPSAAETQLRQAVTALADARRVAGLAKDDESVDGSPPVDATQAPVLHRLLACAAMQRGDREAARAELERSIAIARKQGNDQELALSLQTRAQLEGSESAEAARLFDRLGIEWTPQFPERAAEPAVLVELPRQRISLELPVGRD